MLTERRIREQLNRLVGLEENMPGLFVDMTEIRMAIRIFRWVLSEPKEAEG